MNAVVACAVCGRPINPRTDYHYQADSGRRWHLEHGVAFGPAEAVVPVPTGELRTDVPLSVERADALRDAWAGNDPAGTVEAATP